MTCLFSVSLSAFKEGLRIPPPAMQKIVEGANSDIRQILNQICVWTAGSKSLSFDQVRTVYISNIELTSSRLLWPGVALFTFTIRRPPPISVRHTGKLSMCLFQLLSRPLPQYQAIFNTYI